MKAASADGFVLSTAFQADALASLALCNLISLKLVVQLPRLLGVLS